LFFDESVSISFQNKLQATSKGLIRPNKATKPKEKYYAANRAGPQTKEKHYNQIRTELAIFYM
jgi:hypothetical protein